MFTEKNRGLEITYLDNTSESFDPIQDFLETDFEYCFWVGGYTWNIPKDSVLNVRWYELCNDCGFELFEDDCSYCGVKY